MRSEVVRESWRKARLQGGGPTRTRKPPLPGPGTSDQGSGGHEMQKKMQGELDGLWVTGPRYSQTSSPSPDSIPPGPVIPPVMGLEQTTTSSSPNSTIFIWGGGVHFFGHLRSSLTSQNCDARYSPLIKMSINLLKITLLNHARIVLIERHPFKAQPFRRTSAL